MEEIHVKKTSPLEKHKELIKWLVGEKLAEMEVLVKPPHQKELKECYDYCCEKEE